MDKQDFINQTNAMLRDMETMIVSNGMAEEMTAHEMTAMWKKFHIMTQFLNGYKRAAQERDWGDE